MCLLTNFNPDCGNVERLKDIATIIRGVTFNKSQVSDLPSQGAVPVLRAGNIFGQLDVGKDLVWVPEALVSNDQMLRRNDVVICMSSGSARIVGKSATLEIDWVGSFGAFLAAIRVDKRKCLPEYLAYFLQTDSFRNWTASSSGANIKNIRKSELEAFPIPAPPMGDQRRIVNILKRADCIRNLRKQAQDTARQLIPALFVDMFGDPATNPKKWPVREVADFVQRFEGGKNLKAGTDTSRNDRILKVSAVTSGIYKENESKPAPDEYSPPEKHYVRKGDLLFSRANTEALVGATALVGKTNGKTLLPDKLWRFVFAEQIEPIYIYALFQNVNVRQELSKLSTGTSASMRNISQAKLKTLKLPIPPYEEQMKFADQVRQVQAIQMQQSIALDTATATFNSVLSRAFNGH